jgi:hypothetical protein
VGGLFGGSSGAVSGQPASGQLQVYTPQNQPGADVNWQSIISAMMPSATTAAGTPYPIVTPQAQGIASTLTSPQGYGAYGPYGATAVNQALNSYSTLAGLPYAGTTTGPAASQAALSGLAGVQNAAFNPMYSSAIGAIAGDPYFSQALSGAQTGASIGGTLAPQLGSAAGQLLQTGFDPQSALYNRTAQQLLDQQRAINAMSGVGTSPYGAGVTGQTMENFNIDWQNQQLQRQLSAAQGASQLAPAAANLAATSAGLPASVYNTQQQAILNALGQQTQAAGTGAGALTNLISGLGAAGNIPISYLSALTQAGAQPYNVATGTGQNALSTLSNLLSLGNTQYTLPQNLLNSLANYMQLGQGAAQIGGQLGNDAAQQSLMAGMGLGGLAGMGSNLLFGSQGLSGALGLPAGAGLLGSLPSAGSAAEAANVASMWGGGGEDAVAAGLGSSGSGLLGWLGGLF